mgnify:FL=1
MKKSDLRKIYRQKRQDLTHETIQKLHKNIYDQVFKLDISNVKTVHVFLSLKKFKEIDTEPIIDFFRRKNKQIVVSKSDFSNSTLRHFLLKETTEIVINKYGIPEPINATPILETEIDLVFVPLLISDEQNYRVGYGKGFYDRFLSSCSKDCSFIGLSFFPPIAEIEDVNEFDIPLEKLIYPKIKL